ncbi:MAG TPA: ATP-binding protein [Chitinophagales bacterium]|nr:ATP-binding protein [Chitinophagales bacterium]
MRFSLIDLIFLAFFAMLLLVSYLSYERINGLIVSSELVGRSNTVKLKLEQAISYMKDAETGQRGFLLTQDSSYLQPFYGAIANTNLLLREIDSLCYDDTLQRRNVKELQALIAVRYDFLTVVFQQGDNPQRPGSLNAYLELGRNTMNQVRERIDAMIRLEDHNLKGRISERDKFARFSPLFLLMLSFFTLIAGILAFLKIKNDRQQQEQLVSDLTRRERQITAKNIELENTNAELASFSYIASHDLKEPLRKIQLFSNRILEKEMQILSTSGKEDFMRVLSGVERMQNLLDALLEFSRTNSSEIVFVPTDLNEVLEEATSDLKDLIEEKQAIIQSEVLPVVQAVPVQLRQLFLNLISNAIKYSKPDTIPVIKITAERMSGAGNNQGWHFSFADNGIGFDQQYEGKIFQIFQRLHGRSEYSGTGIGLAICKKIVTNHNGTISATGNPNVGATFHIFLPDNL